MIALGISLGLASMAAAAPPVPAFQSGADLRNLPKSLDPAQFSDPSTREAYAIARRNPKVLAQVPCYCYCDRSVGHKSLYYCFVDMHGADCNICQQEAILAERMSKKGSSIKAIRGAIMRGEWEAVSLWP
jgi:hypothetical protein